MSKWRETKLNSVVTGSLSQTVWVEQQRQQQRMQIPCSLPTVWIGNLVGVWVWWRETKVDKPGTLLVLCYSSVTGSAGVTAAADANSVLFANSCSSPRLVGCSFPFPQIRINWETVHPLQVRVSASLDASFSWVWGADATFQVQRPSEDGFWDTPLAVVHRDQKLVPIHSTTTILLETAKCRPQKRSLWQFSVF